MRPQLLVRKIHKWVGLILGIQILLWFVSGFLMSFMPIEEVRGDHLLKPQAPEHIQLNNIDLSKLAQQVKSPIEAIEVKPWLGKTVIAVTTATGSRLFETPEINPIKLNETQIKDILDTQLKESYEVVSIDRLTEVPDEARGRTGPLWQVKLADGENTRIYISENNGEIVAKRTSRWRLFDFLWMLHIMDYDERSDFNHPLLYLTALCALLFTLSGFVLLYFSLRKKHKILK